MSLFAAENASHLVPVWVIVRIIAPPLLLALIVAVVVLLPDVWAILLASILLVLWEKLLLVILGDNVHTFLFLILLDSLDAGVAS
jgi:hypothetical protein